MSQSTDPCRTTSEMRAVGVQINERLNELLKRMGVPVEEVPARFKRIRHKTGPHSLEDFVKKDQSSTT